MKRKILLFIFKSLFCIAFASLSLTVLALKLLFGFVLLVLSSDDDSHYDDSDYYNILSGELDNTKYHDGIYNKTP